MIFDALASRTPDDPRRTALRRDPFYASLWRGGSTESWWSRRDAARLMRGGGLKSIPGPLRVRPSEAWGRIEANRHRETALRTVAALDMWRTMTAEQVEAMTGMSGIDLGATLPWLSTLWGADLVDFAAVGSALAGGLNDSVARLMRPARKSAATRRFEESLTWPEWVSVTAGFGLEQNRQFDRHNILCAELGLRAAEFANVGTVLGEKLSTFELLTGVPQPGHAAADLTLVRPDGLRVAVEMTASKAGPWIQAKVDRHCEALQRSPLNDTGLCVVFVSAPHQDSSAAEASAAVRILKQAIASAARRYPGTATSPTAERIGVASWTDWFPAPGQVRPDFPALPIERPTARGYLLGGAEEVLWEDANILDPDVLPFSPTFDATAVIRNAAGLRGVPNVLRGDVERPNLSNLSLRNAGLNVAATVEGASTGSWTTLPRLSY